MKSVTETIEASKPSNWVEETPKFTAEHVLKAYDKGRIDGSVDSGQKLLQAKLNENMDLAGKLTEKVFKFLNSKNIEAKFAYLWIENWNNLKIIIGIPEKDFRSDSMKEIYNFVWKLEEENESEFTRVIYSFLGVNLSFNIDCLFADGYTYKYIPD